MQRLCLQTGNNRAPQLQPMPTDVSAQQPDWSRERKRFFQWAPSKSLLASIRAYQHHAASHRPWAVLFKWNSVLRHRVWSVVTGADIPLNSRLGGGLLMPHPNGIVIHPGAQIGPNCLIFQQVTIGARDDTGVPTLGGHVDVGAGAKILGSVVIGEHARVGANSVVLSDVPAHATVVGAPARVIEGPTPGQGVSRNAGAEYLPA